MAASETPPRSLLPMALAVEGGLGLLALALGLLMSRPPLAQIQWSAAGLAWGALGALPPIALLILITRYPLGPLRSLVELSRSLIRPMFRDCTLFEMLLIALAAGVGEELFVRGVVQEFVSTQFGQTWGLALASVLFGLMHPLSLVYVTLAIAMGAYLGWLAIASGNLLAPIMVHALYDFFALFYLVRCRAL